MLKPEQKGCVLVLVMEKKIRVAGVLCCCCCHLVRERAVVLSVSVHQGSTFRRKTAGKPENFPFPLVAGKWNSGIFRHFSFSNLKIQKYL